MRVSVPSLRPAKSIRRESSFTLRSSPNLRKSDYSLNPKPISKTPPPKRTSVSSAFSKTNSNFVEANKALESIKTFVSTSARLPPAKKAEFVDQIMEIKRLMQKIVNTPGSRAHTRQPELFWSSWSSFSSALVKAMKVQQQNIPKQCRASLASLGKKLDDPNKKQIHFDASVLDDIASTMHAFFSSDSHGLDAAATKRQLKSFKTGSLTQSSAEAFFNVEFNSMIAKLLQAVTDFSERDAASKKLVDLLNETIPKLMAAVPTPIEIAPVKEFRPSSPQRSPKLTSRVTSQALQVTERHEEAPQPKNDSVLMEINSLKESTRLHRASISKSNVLIKELTGKIQDLKDEEPKLKKRLKEANSKKEVREKALIQIESLKGEIEELQFLKSELQSSASESSGSKYKNMEAEMNEISSSNKKLTEQIESAKQRLQALRDESVRLQAKNKVLVNNLPKALAAPYEKYARLKETELSLISDLFTRSQEVIRLSHVNRKCLYLTNKNEQGASKEDFFSLEKENEELNRLYQNELEKRSKLEKEYRTVLFDKYLREYEEELLQNETIPEEKVLELESSQDSLEMARITQIEGEATEYKKEIASIKNKTDRSIRSIQSKLKKSLEDLESSLEDKRREYEDLREWYLKSFTNDTKTKVYRDTEMDPEKCLRALEKITKEYSELQASIDKLCLEESKKEQKLIQEEIDFFDSRESTLSDMISSIYKDLIRSQAHTMTLDLQNWLLMQKLKQPDFDVNMALQESLAKSVKDTESLRKLVNGANEKITDIDKQLGSPARSRMSLEDRITSINKRLHL